MTITVRPADEGDADTISALNNAVQDIHAKALPWRFKPASAATFPPSEVRQLIADHRNLVFVAHVDGAPAGYVYAEVIRRPETSRHFAYSMLYIHQISVEPGIRGQGVGSALVGAVQSAGKELGITILALDTWSFNETARSFFRKLGLKAYNERLWNVR